jgi:tol-pal system protein YbgF
MIGMHRRSLWLGPAAAAWGILAGIAVASGDISVPAPATRETNSGRIAPFPVERANAGAGAYRVADIFGESDEEKAARLAAQQHEQAQDSSINFLRQRNEDLENTVRRLTGQLEQLDHRVTDLNGRIERMQKDFDYRLCTMAAQQLGASDEAAAGPALPCDSGTAFQSSAVPPPATTAPAPGPAAAVAPAEPRASGEPVHLGPPNGTLTPYSDTPPPSTAAAASDHRPKFDSAMKLLAKAQYDEARSAFRSFADNYPQDELAPQAVYWIGDIAYVQKDYANAARAFAEEIKKYPDSSRAPDSMLKLGQSLIAMGQKQEGCTALAALPSKYPDASKTIVARAAQERKGSGCK